MTLEDAVDLVLYAFEKGSNGSILVQKAPGATIDVLTKALLDLLEVKGHEINIIGTRHGEKLYEALLSREEMGRALDKGHYFIIPPDNRDLNYGKFFVEGNEKINQLEDYNSHNSELLDVERMKGLLLKLNIVRDFMSRDSSQDEA